MQLYVKGFLAAIQGVPVTLGVTLASIIIGVLLGLVLALMKMSKSKALSVISGVYVEVVRGTPLVVQALILAYGLPQLLQSKGANFKWPYLVIPAIIVCGLNSAAYVAEVIRSGIQAVDKGQMEAARSLGLPYWKAMYKVVLPQAIRTMIPSIINQFIITLKDTSILSVIGFPELVNTAKNVNANIMRSLEVWFIVGVMYLIVITLLSRFAKRMERRLNRGRQ